MLYKIWLRGALQLYYFKFREFATECFQDGQANNLWLTEADKSVPQDLQHLADKLLKIDMCGDAKHNDCNLSVATRRRRQTSSCWLSLLVSPRQGVHNSHMKWLRRQTVALPQVCVDDARQVRFYCCCIVISSTVHVSLRTVGCTNSILCDKFSSLGHTFQRIMPVAMLVLSNLVSCEKPTTQSRHRWYGSRRRRSCSPG